jgi:hypothetical protein
MNAPLSGVKYGTDPALLVIALAVAVLWPLMKQAYSELKGAR